MKKLSYFFYVAFAPAYFFASSYLLQALRQNAVTTYNYPFLLIVIVPVILFMGFGAFIYWKSISKYIKSMGKKESVYLNIVSVLIQAFLIVCATSGVLGVRALILMVTDTIFMVYISFGFDLAMLIHNIRRAD